MFKKTLLALFSLSVISCGGATNDAKGDAAVTTEVTTSLDTQAPLAKNKLSLAEVKANVEAANVRFGGANIVVHRELSDLDLPGLYEASIDGQALVVTSDGKTAIVGDVFSLSTMTNLTRLEKQKGQALLVEQEIAKLDESDFVTYPVSGKKVGQLYVFSDTTCGYCKKLHREIENYQQAGIEVKYIPYPRSALMDGEPAFERMKQVMCAEDKTVAMTEIKAGTDNGAYAKDAYADTCVDSIRKGQMAGRKVGLEGTPLMYLVGADIQIIPGYQASENVISLFKSRNK